MIDVMKIPEAKPSVRLKLHLGHFAFMRALVQGIDTREAWTRYLHIEGEHTDLRVVKRTIAWLRDAFAAAAQRHQRHGIARLVQIDVSTIVDDAPAAPSLEDFIAERGMEDFRESEQLEAYHEEYGNATVRQSRRGFSLLNVDLTESFHRRLVQRGASVIDQDTVQIILSTRLIN
jgi:hypothetical protein